MTRKTLKSILAGLIITSVLFTGCSKKITLEKHGVQFTYEGDYFNGRFNGEGSLHIVDDEYMNRYEGTFRNGIEFQGEFAEGKPVKN